MTIVLIAFTVLTLLADAIFVWQIKDSQKRLDATTRMFEGIVGRLIEDAKSEGEAHRKETDKLLTRIQAPEAVAYHVPDEVQTKQYVTTGDEEEAEGWEAIREAQGALRDMNG